MPTSTWSTRPGYPDFIGRTLPMLEAVETAAVVVSAVAGVEPMSQRMMDAARDRGLCRIVVVNKIDAREANAEAVLEEIREQFGRECLPINLPAARRHARSSTAFSITTARRPISPRSRKRTPGSSTRSSRWTTT